MSVETDPVDQAGNLGQRGENGMAEARYLISDAAKKVDVESHVPALLGEELELNIPRNEMGHRYYTDYHIRLFRRVKELKEKGYQLGRRSKGFWTV